MKTLLEQLKQRRLALNLKQHDLMLRVGMSRQQYQRLESKGNPRLDTLELVAEGLGSELVLVPREKLAAVEALLASDETYAVAEPSGVYEVNEGNSFADDPWKGLLGEDN